MNVGWFSSGFTQDFSTSDSFIFYEEQCTKKPSPFFTVDKSKKNGHNEKFRELFKAMDSKCLAQGEMQKKEMEEKEIKQRKDLLKSYQLTISRELAKDLCFYKLCKIATF